jgi:cell shape-determining protein MreC
MNSKRSDKRASARKHKQHSKSKAQLEAEVAELKSKLQSLDPYMTELSVLRKELGYA